MSKNKVETRLIFKWANLSGYSFMFPAGTQAFIQKAVLDVETGMGAYHGVVFGDRRVTEVQFDASTLNIKGFDDRSNHIALVLSADLTA